MTPALAFDPAAAGPWATVLGIVVAAFVSEDLTCVAVGLLIAAGRVDWRPGLAGCLLGVVLGDFGVWLAGRVMGAGVLRWRWARRRLGGGRLEELSRRLCPRAGRTVMASRVLPGTRVPLFLAAGFLGACPYRFLGWAAVAALVWTPTLVLTAALAGDALAGPLLRAADLGWPVALAAAAGVAGVRTAPRLLTGTGRAKFTARASRLWRWEFWPAWVFYLPLAPWFLALAARYRSLTVWTAANPGVVPAGGVVGESKADILARLPPEWVVPTHRVPAGGIGDRLRAVLGAVAARGWDYPLILKPDAGQRGAGVRKVRDAAGVEAYLRSNPGPVIAQPFHPGPFEAGIFYYRLPGEERGRVFSVTDKVFPVVTGDGRATLEELVWAHPRYRMQAATFLARLAGDAGRVPARGEAVALGLAGNHCQGALFRDGGHLATPELERAVDAIARAFDGFFVGRFDVRYRAADEFRAGRGFAVVELNGVASESTNLYDPGWPLWRAYRTLFRQWALLFRIGAANRRRGCRPASLRELAGLVRAHYRDRGIDPLAD